VFAPDYADLLAPAFVEREEVPLNSGTDVAEDDLCGGMDVQRGGYEVEAGWERGELDAAEVAVALELAEASGGVGGLQVVLANADPVVEALEGEVEIVVGFELDDGEAAVGGDAEEVEEAAVASSGDGRDLGVDVVGVEAGDDTGFWRCWFGRLVFPTHDDGTVMNGPPGV